MEFFHSHYVLSSLFRYRVLMRPSSLLLFSSGGRCLLAYFFLLLACSLERLALVLLAPLVSVAASSRFVLLGRARLSSLSFGVGRCCFGRATLTTMLSRAVHGAIIASYYSAPSSSSGPITSSRTNPTPPSSGEPVSSAFIPPAASNRNATVAMAIRKQSAHEVMAQLPFPVVEWPPMMAQPCPYSANQHKTERGLVFAHLQIWMDFADPGPNSRNSGFVPVDTLTWLPINATTSTTSAEAPGAQPASASTLASSSPVAAGEDDILVVFEDDVGIISKDIQGALKVRLGPAWKCCYCLADPHIHAHQPPLDPSSSRCAVGPPGTAASSAVGAGTSACLLIEEIFHS